MWTYRWNLTPKEMKEESYLHGNIRLFVNEKRLKL
jgi:hypothetical protein